MPTTIEQIRQGLAGNLAAIEGMQISEYMLWRPTPPTIQVFPEAVEYDQSMHGGLDEMHFTIQAFVGTVTDRGAQARLDTLLARNGASSIKTNIEADRTLGGVAQDVRVERATGYRVYAPDPGVPPVLGCEWSVLVYPKP